MKTPDKNIPRAIYTAIFFAIVIYVFIASGALLAIPFDEIIKNKESALASGVQNVLGDWGARFVVLGALLDTSCAISGTLFGASRQMSILSKDGYFPAYLAKRKNGVPIYAI